jgi:hypothetical protein
MIARVIILLIFGGFGVVMLWVGVTQYIQQRRLLTSSRDVEAEIIESRVEKCRSSDTDNRPLRDNSTISYRPLVRFRYRVGDRPYVSDMLRPTIIIRSFASHESAAEEIAAYPEGAIVTARVCDAAPEKAFLVAEASVGPMVFMIVGLLLPPIAWFVGRLV